jgi:hypothetical protein
MIEVSITEIALFCWAILATGYAFKYKQGRQHADMFIRELLENKELRDHIVEDFAQFRKEQQS